METLNQKKAAKDASTPYCDDDAANVGQALMGDQQYWAGSTGADAYEISENIEKLDINLPKRIRVFLKGPDVYEQTFKPSPIKRELRTIKDAIESAKKHEIAGVETNLDDIIEDMHGLEYSEFRGKYGETKARVMTAVDSNLQTSGKGKVSWGDGRIELTGMNGLVSDPVYQKHGPIVYVAFLEHYINRTAENLDRAINKAEALKAIGELESKNSFSFDGKNVVHLDDMDTKGKEEFEKQYGVSKRGLLEEERLGKLKHSSERFAAAVGRELFSHKNFDQYKESDAGIIPIGEGYAFKRIMHSKVKHEIAGVERTLPEILFEGVHGLDDAEFRGKFGETKRKVVESIGKTFYKDDVPEMYAAYVKDLKDMVKKVPESELKNSFSNRTYTELLKGEKPEELRSQLAAGVEDYKKAISEVSSLFMPEQYEAAKRCIEEHDRRFSPQTQYQKDMQARANAIAGLEAMKKKKMLKDPKSGGEFIDAYIKANYGK